MSQCSVPSKVSGDLVSAAEINDMVGSINTKSDLPLKVTLISGDITNGGGTITLSSLTGRSVSLMFINDFPKSTGFTKVTGNNHLDFTDGTTVAANDVIVFL